MQCPQERSTGEEDNPFGDKFYDANEISMDRKEWSWEHLTIHTIIDSVVELELSCLKVPIPIRHSRTAVSDPINCYGDRL